MAYPSGGHILAVRVGTDGRVLDPTPLDLSGSPAPPTGPFYSTQSVIALGDRFIVGWTAQPAGLTGDVRVSRVMLDGRLLDPGGRSVTTAGGERWGLLLATDGTRAFMQWVATASGSRPTALYTQIFDGAMNPLSPLVANTDLLGSSARLPYWDGAGWVLASNVDVVRFDASGARLDAAPRRLSRPSTGQSWVGGGRGGAEFYDPYVAGFFRFDSLGAAIGGRNGPPSGFAQEFGSTVDFDGTTFLVARDRSISTTTHLTLLSRLTPSGTVLDDPPFEVSQRLPGVVPHEGARAHVFTGGQHIEVDLASRVQGAPVGDPGAGSAMARGPGQRILVSGAGIWRYGPTWARLDPTAILTPATTRVGADFDGTNYLVVYTVSEGSPSAQNTYARRLNLDGDFVDSTPRPLSALALGAAPWTLAFGGGTHMVAWTDPSRRVLAARLALDGTPSAPVVLDGTMIPPVGTRVSLSFDGTNFVAAWFRGYTRELCAARVSPAGVVLDPTPLVLVGGGDTAPFNAFPFSTASDDRGSTLVLYPSYDLDTAAVITRGVFLREDGVAFADAGVDVPTAMDVAAPMDAARDVPTDVRPDVVDAPVAVDVPVIMDVRADVPVALDVPVTTDVPVATDTPVAMDVPVATDVSVAVDRPVATDVSVALDTPVATDVSVAIDAPVATDVPVAVDAPVAADASDGSVVADVASDTSVDAGAADDAAPDAGTGPEDVATTDVGPTDDASAASDVSVERDVAAADDRPDAGSPPPDGGSCSARPGAPRGAGASWASLVGVLWVATRRRGSARDPRRCREVSPA